MKSMKVKPLRRFKMLSQEFRRGCNYWINWSDSGTALIASICVYELGEIFEIPKDVRWIEIVLTSQKIDVESVPVTLWGKERWNCKIGRVDPSVVPDEGGTFIFTESTDGLFDSHFGSKKQPVSKKLVWGYATVFLLDEPTQND